MGIRYYAKITFPAAAEQLPTVGAWLRESHSYDVNGSDDVIEVSHAMASLGEIPLTTVLDEARLPYDHFHSHDNAGDPEPETHYVRFDAQGHRSITKVTDEADGDAQLARELLRLLERQEVAPAQLDLARIPGEALGGGQPDWPADLHSFGERQAYQRGVAHARALATAALAPLRERIQKLVAAGAPRSVDALDWQPPASEVSARHERESG